MIASPRSVTLHGPKILLQLSDPAQVEKPATGAMIKLYGVKLPYHADRIEKRAYERPSLTNADSEPCQAPPKQLLPKVVWMSRKAPETCIDPPLFFSMLLKTGIVNQRLPRCCCRLEEAQSMYELIMLAKASGI